MKNISYVALASLAMLSACKNSLGDIPTSAPVGVVTFPTGDAFNGALLPAFFATFGLYRPDQKAAVEMDATGRHASLTSVMEQGKANPIAVALPGFDKSLQLEDKRLIQAVKELEGTLRA